MGLGQAGWGSTLSTRSAAARLCSDGRTALSADDRASLGLAPGAAPTIYCTLSVAADGLITANLLGPLVVNPATRRGRQLVLTDSGYSTRHPVARLASEGGDACSS